MRHSTNLLQNRSGSVVVEAAFVIPLFIFFIVGIVELGRLYWVRTSMQLAVTEAGRHAMVHTDANDDTLTEVLRGSLYALDTDLFNVSIISENNNGINYKVINATYNYVFLTEDLLNLDPLSISTTSKFPILQ